MLCFTSCIDPFYEKKFLSKYEFEDFSQFESSSIFIRGGDSEGNPIIFINAPHLVRDTSKVGCCVVILDKKSGQVIGTKWTLTDNNVNADTVKLQQLAQAFMQYGIPRMEVDEQGNVFVYLKDVETLALAKFVNENELQKHNEKMNWINIKHNWYKPK